MLIPVIYPNGSHDLVKDFYLDYLISSKKIEKFKRSSGWVSITSPLIRGKRSRAYYLGPERRQDLINGQNDAKSAPMNIEFYPADKSVNP